MWKKKKHSNAGIMKERAAFDSLKVEENLLDEDRPLQFKEATGRFQGISQEELDERGRRQDTLVLSPPKV